jgi:hypothetical protein
VPNASSAPSSSSKGLPAIEEELPADGLVVSKSFKPHANKSLHLIVEEPEIQEDPAATGPFDVPSRESTSSSKLNSTAKQAFSAKRTGPSSLSQYIVLLLKL